MVDYSRTENNLSRQKIQARWQKSLTRILDKAITASHFAIPRLRSIILYIIIKITGFKKRLIVYENVTEHIVEAGAVSDVPYI